MKSRAIGWVNLLALFTSLLWAGVTTEAASAHALLVRSLPEADAVLPQPPSKIEFWFTEALEPGFSQARLFNSNGQEVPTGAVNLDPVDDTHMTLLLETLEPGVYTVAWQTLSKADGHEFSGSFPFTLLNPDGTRPGGKQVDVGSASRSNLPTPGEVLARWLWLLGSAILFGAVLFQLIVVPARVTVGQREAASLDAAAQNLTVTAIWITALAITLGQGLFILLQAFDLGGLDLLPDLLIGTRSGALILARQTVTLTILLVALKLPQSKTINKYKRVANFAVALPIVVLTTLLMLVAAQGEYLLAMPPIVIGYLGLGLVIWMRDRATPTIRRRLWAFIILLAGVLLLDTSLASHASSGLGSFWAVLADLSHLLAAGAWIGGLLLIGALLWQQHRLPGPERPVSHRSLLLLVERFSYLASFCVFVLLLTGLFNSLVQLPQISLLWQTIYGRVLLLKLGLIVLVLGIAFFNNRLVHGSGNRHAASSTQHRLDRQIVLEAGVALLLMVSVAVLVQTPTPRDAALASAAQQQASPFNTVVTADDLSLHVQVTPNQVGNDRFWMHIYHADGSPVGEIQLVQLRFNYRDVPLGQAKVDLASLGGDAFAIEGAYLSQAGAWDLSAYIRRRDQDDTMARFSLDVPAPTVVVTPSNPWENPIPALSPTLLMFCFVVTLAVIPVIWRQPLQQAWSWYKFSWRGVILLTFAVLFIGLVWLLSFGTSYFNASTAGGSGSAEAVSFEQGKALYEENCLSCHGATGLGDGPAASGLNQPPANLQVHLAGGAHTDEQLFNWISNGIPNTDMPAFGTIISTEERWQVVSYIRTLVPKSKP